MVEVRAAGPRGGELRSSGEEMTSSKAKKKKSAVEETPADQVDMKLFKALRHPLRVRVLKVLNERASSPTKLADELNENLGNVSYHVKVLEKLDQIELVDTAQRRGAVEHFYRGIRRVLISHDAFAKFDPHIQHDVVVETFEQIIDDASHSAAAGSFSDRPDSHVSWTGMSLDDDGWSELQTLLAEVLERAFGIEAAALARMQNAGVGPADAIKVKMALAGYESIPAA